MPKKKNDTRRTVNGILLLNKPSGISSNLALQKVKRIFNAKKAGHTGSLDPLASGMLPICFGEATKFSQFLLESDKTYRVSAKLGVRTTTSDREGEVLSQREVPHFSKAELNTVLDTFRGDIDQVPSMYSAIKYQGQPLYKLARQGITVDRPSRRVTVYELNLDNVDGDIVHFNMRCSKGTYVRTLVDDFGEVLGCGAHVIALHRDSVGPYPMDSMMDLEALENIEDFTTLDSHLLLMSTAVSSLPELRLTESMAFYLQQGQSVFVSKAPASGQVRLSFKSGRFLGVGEMQEGKLVPRRLLSQESK